MHKSTLVVFSCLLLKTQILARTAIPFTVGIDEPSFMTGNNTDDSFGRLEYISGISADYVQDYAFPRIRKLGVEPIDECPVSGADMIAPGIDIGHDETQSDVISQEDFLPNIVLPENGVSESITGVECVSSEGDSPVPLESPSLEWLFIDEQAVLTVETVCSPDFVETSCQTEEIGVNVWQVEDDEDGTGLRLYDVTSIEEWCADGLNAINCDLTGEVRYKLPTIGDFDQIEAVATLDEGNEDVCVTCERVIEGVSQSEVLCKKEEETPKVDVIKQKNDMALETTPNTGASILDSLNPCYLSYMWMLKKQAQKAQKEGKPIGPYLNAYLDVYLKEDDAVNTSEE